MQSSITAQEYNRPTGERAIWERDTRNSGHTVTHGNKGIFNAH